MKRIKIITLALLAIGVIVVASGFTKERSNCQNSEAVPIQVSKQDQMINLFVTHGHCSTPFSGHVKNVKVIPNNRKDLGNPLENMKISFEIDPNSFVVCRGDELTAKIKTPGLFIGENNEMISFKSTQVYTMGLDWYQVNGEMTIKGVVNEVKLFVTGIRNPKDTMPSELVVSGQVNLLDWGIDYDKIVNGMSNPIATKWMFINMRIDMR